MAKTSSLKGRASARKPALSKAAQAAADALGDLAPSERAAAKTAAAPVDAAAASTLPPAAPDRFDRRKSGNLGGYCLRPKRGRGTLGGHYLGPLTAAQREAIPLPAVEVRTGGAVAQVPQDPAHPVSSKPKPKTHMSEKKVEEIKKETVPGHDTKVETKTEETQHQPETKVETKTETTEPK
jgi:hypothetical protein